QILHVVSIDLVERTVAGRVIVAPDHQPVGRVGIAQHRVGHAREVLDLTRDSDAFGLCRSAALSALSTTSTTAALSRLARCRCRCCRAVLLKNERDDVAVFLCAQSAWPLRGHGDLYE